MLLITQLWRLRKPLALLTIWVASQVALCVESVNELHNKVKWTKVEQEFIRKSGKKPFYSSEKIPIIQIDSVYALGKLTAINFIDWCKKNPSGVVSLPTGKSAEIFIKYLSHYKYNWDDASVRQELLRYGIKGEKFPDTSNLKYVQSSEFYPIEAHHEKNARSYILRYYVNLLEIKPQNLLTIDVAQQGILKQKGINAIFPKREVDLSLLDREPSNRAEDWQKQAIIEAIEYCKAYEAKIKSWGGIGFLITNIGYDGHLAYNLPGDSFDSTTRLVKLTFPATVHAAKNLLGGFEYTRDKTAITIGLGTLRINKNAKIIIMARGDIRAKVVKNAATGNLCTSTPASCLQYNPNVRMYVSSSAGRKLCERKLENIQQQGIKGFTPELIDSITIDIALRENKRIQDLKLKDFNKTKKGQILVSLEENSIGQMVTDVDKRLREKLERGLDVVNSEKKQNILHLAPYHDDLLLGYYPLLDKLHNQQANTFAYLTSNYNAVTDKHVIGVFNRIEAWWLAKVQDYIFKKPYTQLLKQFKKDYYQKNTERLEQIETVMVLKFLSEIYKIDNLNDLINKIRWLKDDYFENKLAGETDNKDIQRLKMLIRMSEADRLWAIKHSKDNKVLHINAKFYNGKPITRMPELEQDVQTIAKLLNSKEPDIITVADDPQGSGPGIHHLVLQVAARAVKQYPRRTYLRVWGYRNGWFNYNVDEANILIPVTQSVSDDQDKLFKTCFTTQVEAPFPYPFYKGSFSNLAREHQIESLQKMKVLLGEEYFNSHPNKLIREAIGLTLVREMQVYDFLSQADSLQKYNES